MYSGRFVFSEGRQSRDRQLENGNDVYSGCVAVLIVCPLISR